MYINNYTSQLKMTMNQMNQATRSVSQSQAKISSGDSFAGRNENPVSYSQASRAEALMRGSSMASKNIQDANSFLETKESGLAKMDSIGQRLRDLAVQYENDLLNEEDKSLIQKESASLLKELEHSLKNTTFNGKNVFEPKDVKVQTGSSASDTFTIKSNPLFSFSFNAKEEVKPVPPVVIPTPEVKPPPTPVPPIEEIEPQEPVNGGATEKTYDLSVKSGPYSDPKAQMSVQGTKDPNVSTFTVKSNNQIFSGTINFSTNGKNTFEMNTRDYGKVTGEFKMDKNASKDDLDGKHQFLLDKKFNSVVLDIQMKDTTVKPVVPAPKAKAVTVSNDLPKDVQAKEVQTPIVQPMATNENNSKEIKFELSTDFIDKHILKPIAESRAQVGVEMNALEYRLESAGNTEVHATSHLSRVRDTDTAKEVMKMTKQQMLTDINANLFSKSLDQYRSHILSLLS